MNYIFHQTEPARPGKHPAGWQTERTDVLRLIVQNDEGEVVTLRLTDEQALKLAAELQTRAVVKI